MVPIRFLCLRDAESFLLQGALPDNHSMSDTHVSFERCVIRFSGRRRVRNCNACFRARFSFCHVNATDRVEAFCENRIETDDVAR